MALLRPAIEVADRKRRKIASYSTSCMSCCGFDLELSFVLDELLIATAAVAGDLQEPRRRLLVFPIAVSSYFVIVFLGENENGLFLRFSLPGLD